VSSFRTLRNQFTVHGDWFWDNTKDRPELYNYIPFGPFDSKEQLFEEVFVKHVQQDRGCVLFAAYDKVFEPNPTPAGIIGLWYGSPEHLSVEIAFVVVFPRYQRTHLATNMVGLLLEYCLEVPEKGGLGLRRVQWRANAQNTASIRLALRLGFIHEGVKRWERIVPAAATKSNTAGRLPREGDPRRADYGRHTAVLGLCWDDWEDGARGKVGELMKPRENGQSR